MGVVFVDEVLWDVGELDLRILRVVELCREVVVRDVVSDELRPFSGDDAVEEEFAEVEGSGFSSGITCVYAVMAHDGDMSAVSVVLFGAEFANNGCDGDAFRAIERDVAEEDGAEGIGVFDALAGALRFLAEALAEAAELFAIGDIPYWFKFGVAAKLAV